MENANIYDLLRSHPIQTNITIKKMIEEEIPLTHLTIGEFQMPSWSEFAAETLHPIRSMPFITKFFICGLLVLIIMITIKYLYKKNLLCCIRNNNMVNIPYMLPPEPPRTQACSILPTLLLHQFSADPQSVFFEITDATFG